MQPNELGGLALIKMAGYRILHHCLEFLFGVSRSENRVPKRSRGKAAFGCVFD